MTVSKKNIKVTIIQIHFLLTQIYLFLRAVKYADLSINFLMGDKKIRGVSRLILNVYF